MASKTKKGDINWTSLALEIQAGIGKLWQEDSCTDFVIEIGKKSFRCHKVVLSSVSDYFKAMFNSGMKETEQNKAVLDDVSPESFEKILKILYTDRRMNPLENSSETEMTDLLKLAGRFQMTFLQTICLNYFERTISVTNCILRWKLGEEILCDELSVLGWVFLTEHFEELTNENSMVSLGIEDFLTVVRDYNMHVKRESIVWTAIETWINFDRHNRCSCIGELLRECCLTEIDPDFLVEEIAFNPAVRHNETASQLVQDTIKYRRHPSIHGNIELKFRKCHEYEQVAFVLLKERTSTEDGHVDTNPLKGLLMSNAGRHWRMNCMMKHSRYLDELACCVHEHSVYVLMDNSHFGCKLWEYNGLEHSWESQREMDQPLLGQTMCSVDGCLYVLGGRCSLQMNAQVWQYSIESNSWSIEGEILAPVMHASSVAVNNKLYIFGGELDNNIPADCVQMYDTETQLGTIFCNMPNPFSWSRAVVRGYTVYVVTSEGDVMRVSLETGKSDIIASVPNFKRVAFGIDLRRNELKVFGGKETDETDTIDEEYEGTDKEYEDTDKDTSKTGEMKNFVVNVDTGCVHVSQCIHLPGYQDIEVLGSVSVVLTPVNEDLEFMMAIE